MLTRVLGVENVLVNNECRSSSVSGRADSHLPKCSVLPEDFENFLSCDSKRKVLYEENPIYFWRKPPDGKSCASHLSEGFERSALSS